MRIDVLLAFLLVGLAAGCTDQRPLSRLANDIRGGVPAGWTVTSSNSTVRLQSEREVILIGRITRPPGDLDEVARIVGQTTKYEVTLTFVPRLSVRELEMLRGARQAFEHILDTGTRSKNDYTKAQIGYNRHNVPTYYTEDYSIFVDRPVDRFVEVYPPDAAAQVEGLEASLRGLFREY